MTEKVSDTRVVSTEGLKLSRYIMLEKHKSYSIMSLIYNMLHVNTDISTLARLYLVAQLPSHEAVGAENFQCMDMYVNF